MEDWNYLEQITNSKDYIALSKAMETYCSEIPDDTINVNDLPYYIRFRSDFLPKIIESIKYFMEEYHLQMIYIGGAKFIYGEENN